MDKKVKMSQAYWVQELAKQLRHGGVSVQAPDNEIAVIRISNIIIGWMLDNDVVIKERD